MIIDVGIIMPSKVLQLTISEIVVALCVSSVITMIILYATTPVDRLTSKRL